MKFFRTRWSTATDQPVEGDRPYCLPLLTCPVCGNFRGKPGISYPWFDPKKLTPPWEKRLRSGRYQEFSWEEYCAVRLEIRKHLKNWPLPPSAEFGPFRGKLFKKPMLPDFVIPNGVVLLARKSAVAELTARGHNLQVFEIAIKNPPPEGHDLVEIWAPPIGRAAPSYGDKWCDQCDRAQSPPESKLIVGEDENSKKHCVFKLREDSWPFLFSEAFVRDVKVAGLTGLEFEPVESE
jgi:hypothetical protein